MARPRASITALAKLLAGLAEPVYVLDEDREIVYCNAACAQWTGLGVEQLCGQRCDFHSSAAEGDPVSIAAALCPPPEVFAGTALGLTITLRANDGPTESRRVQFIPIGRNSTPAAGVIALVEPADAGADRADADRAKREADEAAEALALHELVSAFHARQGDRYRLDRLIGDSAAIRRVRNQVEAASQTDASVLLVGPPGSGRQHVAKSVHYARHNVRGAQPPGDYAGTLAPLSCALLGAETLQAAVTGLVRRAAERHPTRPGTLLLLDVEQLPAEAQVELSGFLMLPNFQLRIIATSTLSCDELSAQGQLRDEMLCAISTIAIELPALRERAEDIPLLAQALLEEHNARGGKQLGGFSPVALDRLAGYHWPGEVDELIDVIRLGRDEAQGPLVEAEDLPQRIAQAADAARYPVRQEEAIVMDEFLAEVETELIRRALARSKGNKAKAARLLGLTRPRLYRRMVQLGLAEGGDAES
ncbi:MAG: sigma 54-interacting transcriptional regulator [Planctomycetes bacterium]|nr:sigma 54-interacting transcriptional regulator [Planctomycetota bacterium]